MADTLVEQIEQLQRVYDLDLIDAAAFQRGLSKLRAVHGSAAVDALLSADELHPGAQPPAATNAQPPGSTQSLGDYAQIAVNVVGDVHGVITVYQDGQASPSALLRSYAQQQIQRLAAVPLHGLWEQKTIGDTPVLPLAQVYVEQALSTEVDRETFDGVELMALRDEQRAQQLIERHVGEAVLPAELRFWVRVFRAVSGPQIDGAEAVRRDEFIDLQALAADDLSLLVRDAERLTLVGPQLVVEAVRDYPRLVLLGEAGSGKSTVLRYLVLALAQQLLAAGATEALPRVPLLVPLQPLAQVMLDLPERVADGTTLWRAIAAYLERIDSALALTTALGQLRDGGLLLLLDGLDEVASLDTRVELAEAIHQFGQAYPGCRIIVSCRTRVYRGRNAQRFQLPRWTVRPLAPWNRAQMERFVAAWYSAIPDEILPNEERLGRARTLIAALQERPDLRRIGERPLLLTMAALVLLNDGRLAGSRTTLYSRCVDLLLGRWDVVGKTTSGFGSLMDFVGLPGDANALLPLLSRVAFAAHGNGSGAYEGSLRRNDLRLTVIEALQAAGHPQAVAGAERFLRYIDERAGLIQLDESGDAYVFIHPSFKEYLAGRELVRGVEPVDNLLGVRADERWHAPIVLGIGHLIGQQITSVPYRFLARLIHPSGRAEQRQRDILLAATIGEDIGWERLISTEPLFAQLRDDLRRQLVVVIEGRALTTAERVRAAGLLGALGDPRSGVCDLSPALVLLPSARIQLGSEAATIAEVGEEYARHYARRDPLLAEQARLWPANELNDAWIALPAVQLARYLVTNAQYTAFVESSGYDLDAPWWDEAGRAWLRRDDSAHDLRPNRRRGQKRAPAFWDDGRMKAGRANHPVVGVNVYEACAFAAWLTQQLNDGRVYRLPSEAEWEYAARGTSRRTYPWGPGEPTDDRANFGDTYGATTPVGCFPGGATPEELLDLAGNVWEWTRSIFRAYPYNDHAPSLGALITVRGGSWHSRAIRLRAATRNRNDPDMYFDDLGFRLAADDNAHGS
jgi:formylglycine-generating enzyme required for sulfatase activity